jgi:hypothetical protein
MLASMAIPIGKSLYRRAHGRDVVWWYVAINVEDSFDKIPKGKTVVCRSSARTESRKQELSQVCRKCETRQRMVSRELKSSLYFRLVVSSTTLRGVI